jgi:hypothetical protein
MWSSGHLVNLRRLGTSIAVAALVLSGLTVYAAESAQTAKATVQKAKAKSKKKTPDPTPVAPPAPLLPYQLPAQPPKVTFLNGQLTIVAENSTLGSVMEQIRAATGASFEGSYVGGERVSTRLGPGAPRDVIADLLNGSNYNYVLLGSLEDPLSLERVIVSQRGAPVPSTSAAAPARTFPVRVQQPQPEPEEEVEPEPEAEETPEMQQVPPETTPAPGQVNPQATPQPGATPGTPGQPPQVKTPQELLQELQERMRKQQEEQNQERNDQQRKQQEEEPE